jgi:energy-coupling factor transporter ATP-binding protein EcfA2
LYDSDWIPVNDLTVFIGENDSGKTAALDGITILLGPTRGSVDDISFKPGPGETDPNTGESLREDHFRIEGRFLPEAQDEHQQGSIPHHDDGTIEIGLKLGTQGEEWYATGNVPIDPDLRINPSDVNINDLRELLRSKGASIPGGTTKAPLAQAVRQLIANSPKAIGSVVVKSPPHPSLFKVVDFRSARDVDSVLNATLRTLFAQLIKSESYTELSKVEAKVRRVLQAKADELKEFVARHRPDVQDVLVQPQVDFSQGYRNVEIAVTDTRGSPIPLELRGQGLRAHLRLAAFEWSGQILSGAGSATRIFLLDEPDTHLDYYAQRRILGVIEEYARNGQVFLATHSMNLINRVGLDRIVHFELDRASGKSSPRRIQASGGSDVAEMNRIGESLGIENAVFFYERCFFLFEGETEAQSLPGLYEVWSGSKWYLDGVRFLNGHNNEGAILFGRFLHTSGRRVVALIDEDTTLKKGFQRQFTRSRLEGQTLLPPGRIITIGPAFFELAFSDSVWTRAVFRATGGKRRINRAKLGALRTNPRQFVRYLEKRSGLSKVQLGVSAASVTKKTEIPEALADAFALAQKLAKR